MLTILTALALVGCDVDEGPREEAEEAVRAAERGASEQRVSEEAREIVVNRADTRNEVDRELRKIEAWVAETRRDLRESGREASEEMKQQLDKVERQTNELRRELDALNEEGSDWDRFRDRFNQSMRNISNEIDKLDGEINDKAGDEVGRG